MKIISQHKDYYDAVAASWYTEEPLFLRRYSKELVKPKSALEQYLKPIFQKMPSLGLAWDGYGTGYRRVAVFFCGSVYFMWTNNSDLLDPSYKPYLTASDWFGPPIFARNAQDISEHIKILLEGDSKYRWGCNGYFLKTLEEFEVSEKKKYSWRMTFNADNIKEFQKEHPNGKVSDSFFIEYGAPYFVVVEEKGSLTIHINANIKPVMGKLFDAYACFQEISMYLGNALVKPDEGPNTVGSDRVVALQKGFDDMSFRTLAPGAKKLNRKENKLRKSGKLPIV